MHALLKNSTDLSTGVGAQSKAAFSPNGWKSEGGSGIGGGNHPADSMREHEGVHAALCKV